MEGAKSRSYYKKYRSLIIRRWQWGKTCLNPSIVDILKRYFEFSIETTQLRQLILLPYGEHSKLIFAYLENAKKSRSIHLMRSNKNLHVINVSHMGDK